MKKIGGVKDLELSIKVWVFIKRVISVILSILYLAYIVYKAPVFTDLTVKNSIDYLLVLIFGCDFVYRLLESV